MWLCVFDSDNKKYHWPLDRDIYVYFYLGIQMKKLTLTLILATMTSLGYAQSSVQVYGIMDTSVQSFNSGTQRLTRMQDNQWNTSRLGFRGSEDLGGGLKANFMLEGQLNPSQGSMGSTSTVVANEIFNRDAWVGFSGGFGEVRLGRQDVNKMGELDAFITLPIAGNYAMHPVNGTSVELGTDQKNVVSYFTPKYNGFRVIVGQATNSTNATTDAGTTQNGVTVHYEQGPWKAGIGYQKNDAPTEVAKRWATTYGVGYDFRVAEVGAVWAVGDNSTTSDVTSTSGSFAVKVPLQNNYNVHVVYTTTKNGLASTANKGNGYTLIGTKDFSKRTKVYAAYSLVTNESNSSMRLNNGTAPTAPGLDTRGLGIGMMHTF